MQFQNTVGSYYQTHNSMFAAIMADTELLLASFWGLGKRATTGTMNFTTNSLCQNGNTPAFYMSGATTNLLYQFRVGFGKPVVCTRVKKPEDPKTPGQARNEFGVSVGSNSRNVQQGHSTY